MNKRLKYFILTVISFALCALIVLFFSENDLIRGFIGDVVVIHLLFYFFKIFVDSKTLPLVLVIVGFAFLVEILQLFRLVDVLGLAHYRLAVIVLGATFDPLDLLAYSLGGVSVWITDYYISKSRI